MASQVQYAWDHALSIEKKLRALIKGASPTFEEIDHYLTQLRIACETVVFLDFEFAHTNGVGNKLWDTHSKINARYRKLVEAFKKGDQRKHVVEKRKLEKRYVDFIKTSQYFYKGYIQRLASHYEGLTGLYRVAHRLSLNLASVDDRVQVPDQIGKMIEDSCHSTLLRLGDLSRYRNMLRTRDRSWDAALAYYSLANDLYPDSGYAHNQMSVIYLHDGDHLPAVYHMYRALAIKEPHPNARGNLELEFKKIISKNGQHPRLDKNDSLGTLITWFSLLHARYDEGVEFSTHEELENEVLSRLSLLLKEQSFPEVLEKFVLINIAAQDVASKRVTESVPPNPLDLQAFKFTLGFNVRFMFTLLQTLQPELEDTHLGEDIPNGTSPSKAPERITATCRRILPALRQYSFWMISNAQILAAYQPSRFIVIHIKDLWKMYADVLTRLISFFPAAQLKQSPYLLEEDSDTVGYQPFRDDRIPKECNIYVDNDGNMKPRITDKGVERNHPNVEMQARVLDMISVAVKLVTTDEYPISFNGDTARGVFYHVEQGLPTMDMALPRFEPQADENIPSPVHRTILPVQGDIEISQDNFETELARMVDGLVESKNNTSDETSYGMHSQTALELFAPLTSNVTQSHSQSMPNLFPSLPGIWNSPFAPQPNELQPRSSGSRINTDAYATREKRLLAAQELDRTTGHASWARSGTQRSTGLSQSNGYASWARSGTQRNSGPSQDMRDASGLFHNTLPPPTASSDFPDSSGIFGGTPNRFHQGLSGMAPGNNSTYYPGASDFDKHALLQSSPWENGQPVCGKAYSATPPGGQIG